MKELIEQMKVSLASVFALYLKTHNFHFNVEGPNFPQYHDFLGDMYEEIFDSFDPMAEELRTLQSYVPASLSRFQALSIVEDELNIPTPINMMKQLQADNLRVIVQLKKTHRLAEEENASGLVNFLEDRIDKHYKHDWKLRSITKVN